MAKTTAAREARRILLYSTVPDLAAKVEASVQQIMLYPLFSLAGGERT